VIRVSRRSRSLAAVLIAGAAARLVRGSAVLALLAVALLVAPPARARAAEVNVHGLLDLVFSGKSDAGELNQLWKGDSRFDTYAARLFVDGAVTDRVQVFTQLLVSETPGVRAMGAYAMADPWEGRDIHVIAGLIPYLVGTYDPRSYSDKNPLIGIPMLYQHHTTLRWDQLPISADALLAKAGSGYRGVNFASAGPAYPGMPVIYEHWWDFGAGITGSARPFEFALGLENGTPSFPDPTRDENGGKAVLGRIGLAPTPGLRFGVSGAYGPYLESEITTALPPGRRPEDYNQVLTMADAEWSGGYLEVRGEGYRNRWQTPTVGDLRVSGFYAEAKVKLPAGFYAAGRYEIMRFGDLADSLGARRSWDTNWDRGEAGIGYRVARDVTAKAVVQWNRAKSPGPGLDYRRADIAAAQLSIRF
jgi:hypothetical protein